MKPKSKEWASQKAAVSADGFVRFDHVRPDRYTLSVDGPRVTPKALALDVVADDFDLGEIRLVGRGRIRGRVFVPNKRGGGVAAFTTCRVEWNQPPIPRSTVEFVSDEDGRFSVEGVPVGLVSVDIPYAVGHTESSDNYSAQVCENQTTDLRIFDPESTRPLPLEIRVGDGSRAQHASAIGLGGKRKVKLDQAEETRFWAVLVPHPGRPLSFANSEELEVDANGRGVLPDCGAGTYLLRVMNGSRWRNVDECLFEREITIPTVPVPVFILAARRGHGPVHRAG